MLGLWEEVQAKTPELKRCEGFGRRSTRKPQDSIISQNWSYGQKTFKNGGWGLSGIWGGVRGGGEEL